MLYWQCKALLLDEKERTMKKLLAALLALLLLTGCQKKKKREKSLGKMHGNSSYRLKVIRSSQLRLRRFQSLTVPGENPGIDAFSSRNHKVRVTKPLCLQQP